MGTAPPTLPVIIIGAGIVGLALAQSLRQKSIPFEIYERDTSLQANPTGWGLTLHWALSDLQTCLAPELFQRLKDVQVDPQQPGGGRFQFLNIKTGEVKFMVPPSQRIRIVRKKFRALLTEGIDVQWDKAITKFVTDPTNGTVEIEFQDGTKTKGCVLIGADGSASRTRRFLLAGNDNDGNDNDNDDNETARTKELPVSLIGVTMKLTAEQIRPLRDIDPLLFNGTHPDNGKFMWYSLQTTPEANGSAGTQDEFFECQLIFSWITTNQADQADQAQADMTTTTSSSSKARLAKMKEIGKTCEPKFRKIIDDLPDDTNTVTIKLSDWPTIPWNNRGGLVTLAGDAAHPMVMYRGEGANHGLADAANISNQLSRVFSGDISLQQAIQNYEVEMQPRGRSAVLLSRQACIEAHDYHNLSDKSPLLSERVRNPHLSR